MAARRTCPVCRKSVGPKDENPAFPLCSERCRLIDLGNWLGEQYRVPGDPIDPTQRPSSSSPEGEDQEP